MTRRRMISTPTKIDLLAACWNCKWYRMSFARFEEAKETFAYCGHHFNRQHQTAIQAAVSPDGVCDDHEKN